MISKLQDRGVSNKGVAAHILSQAVLSIVGVTFSRKDSLKKRKMNTDRNGLYGLKSVIMEWEKLRVYSGVSELGREALVDT